MSTSLVVAEMVLDAQELLGEDVDELTALLEDIATLGSTEVPTPSTELAQLLAGGSTPARRRSSHPARARRGALAGLAAAAVSGLSLTGAAAVANELPVPVQRVVAHLSEQYLPFTFPRPAGDPPAPGTAPSRAPKQGHGDRVGGVSSPNGTSLPGGLAPDPGPSAGPQAGRLTVPLPSASSGPHVLKGGPVEDASGLGQTAQPPGTVPGAAPGDLPTGVLGTPAAPPSGIPADTPTGTPTGTPTTPAQTPAGTPVGTPSDAGTGTGTDPGTGAGTSGSDPGAATGSVAPPEAGSTDPSSSDPSSSGTGSASGQSSGPTSPADQGNGLVTPEPSASGTGFGGRGDSADNAEKVGGMSNLHRDHRGGRHGFTAAPTPTAGPETPSASGSPTVAEQDAGSDGAGG